LIEFFSEDIEFEVAAPHQLRQWLQKVIRAEQCVPGDINYIFTSDDYLLALNQNYLQHETYTDILTFDQSTDSGSVSGDIYISIDRVRVNAGHYRQTFGQELKRVMVHGMLHLIGYNDQSPEEKSEMRKKEEAYLSL